MLNKISRVHRGQGFFLIAFNSNGLLLLSTMTQYYVVVGVWGQAKKKNPPPKNLRCVILKMKQRNGMCELLPCHPRFNPESCSCGYEWKKYTVFWGLHKYCSGSEAATAHHVGASGSSLIWIPLKLFKWTTVTRCIWENWLQGCHTVRHLSHCFLIIGYSAYSYFSLSCCCASAHVMCTGEPPSLVL